MTQVSELLLQANDEVELIAEVKLELEMPFHPVAGLFPMMSDTEFTALVEDIRHNGLLEPIWVQ